MTDVLARLKVREGAGIRRFLYPLTIKLSALPVGLDLSAASLTLPDGTPVPCQLTREENGPTRLDFAVFLAPFEETTLTLARTGPQAAVPDPLHVVPVGTGLRSTQKRFAVTLGEGGFPLRDVVYDDVFHLRGRGVIAQGRGSLHPDYEQGYGPLAMWHRRKRSAHDGGEDETRADLTACKSWVTLTRTLETPAPGDVVTFTLPLAVHAPALLCDFGVGGGTYGKLQPDSTEYLVWRSEFVDGGTVKWSIATNGRVDYVGTAPGDAYHAQQWFHVIDGSKALAAAITHVPASCRVLQVTLGASGDVAVDFTLGDKTDGPAVFGVCWHFLNDVPAIAAATNPQSILLPPTVEVMPA